LVKGESIKVSGWGIGLFFDDSFPQRHLHLSSGYYGIDTCADYLVVSIRI